VGLGLWGSGWVGVLWTSSYRHEGRRRRERSEKTGGDIVELLPKANHQGYHLICSRPCNVRLSWEHGSSTYDNSKTSQKMHCNLRFPVNIPCTKSMERVNIRKMKR